MSDEEFNELAQGDIVKHVSQPGIWVVSANYGGRVTLIRTADATNPIEWELFLRATYHRPKKARK